MSYNLQIYDGYEYSIGKPYIQKIINYILKYSPKGSRVLEVGCWTGELLEVLQKYGYKVNGYELNETAIAECKKKKIKVDCVDLGKTINSVNKYDVVVAAEIIEHIYDTGRMLGDIYNILTDKGFFILSTPNLSCLRNRIKGIFGCYLDHLEFDESGCGHIRIYNKSVLLNQLKQKGFKIVLVSSPNFPFPINRIKVPKFIMRILFWLGDLFPVLGNQLIVVAQKDK